MPITKHPKKRQPIWKDADRLAQKEGLRHAVHAVNGDVYTGEWADNKKCGTYVRTHIAPGYALKHSDVP